MKQVRVLYSPVHEDRAAAARSLARAYMALLRHYSGQRHATIEVFDEPLTLDLTPVIFHFYTIDILLAHRYFISLQC